MASPPTITDQYVLFKGGFLSQWHPSNFVVDGVPYTCCEQFMMAEKARVFGDHAVLGQILQASHPRAQKALGRTVRNFDDSTWRSVCRGIVYRGNLAKFTQDNALADQLLATGGRTIVEASRTDRIWGIGLSPTDPRARDPAQWRGTNWLGIALMQVRDALRPNRDRSQIPDDPELIQQLGARRLLEMNAVKRNR